MKNAFVLITLLIFLLILSLLAVYAMENSVLQYKMSHNFHKRERSFYAAEVILRKAEEAVESQERQKCDISQQSIASNYVFQVKNNRSLPLLPACHLDLSEKEKGYYVVQKIHEIANSCLDPYKEATITYYRITAWLENSAFIQNTFLIQSTYAKIEKIRYVSSCQWPMNPFNSSTRLSWRSLS